MQAEFYVYDNTGRIPIVIPQKLLKDSYDEKNSGPRAQLLEVPEEIATVLFSGRVNSVDNLIRIVEQNYMSRPLAFHVASIDTVYAFYNDVWWPIGDDTVRAVAPNGYIGLCTEIEFSPDCE